MTNTVAAAVAVERLRPVISEIQKSFLALLDSMIALGAEAV